MRDARRQRKGRTVQDLRRELNDAANRGDITATEQAFGAMVSSGDVPTTVTMNILIKAYGRGKQPLRGYRVLESMMFGLPEAYGAIVTEGTFNAVVAGYAENANLQAAWDVLHMQHRAGFSVQASFGSILRNTSSENILAVLQNAVREYAIIVDGKMLNTALVATLEKPAVPDMSQAECVIRFAELLGTKLDPKGCTLVLTAFGRLKQPRDAIQFFEDYAAKGNLPDLKLSTTVVNLLVTHEPPMMDKAEAMVEKMKSTYFLKVDVVVLNSMIKGFGRTKPPQVDKALAIYESIIESHELRPTAHTFSAVSNVLCSVGRTEEGEEIMRAMEQHGLEPMAVHYNILLKGYSRCRCKLMNGFCKCKICSCSNPERSLELLAEMESKGLVCDSITIQSLIESFCSAAQVEKALSIVNNVMKNPRNVKTLAPSTSVYNMILRGICVKYFIPTGSDPSQCGGKRTSLETLDMSKREEALQQMNAVIADIIETGLRPDDVTFNTKIGVMCAFAYVHAAHNYLLESIPLYRKRANILIGFNTILNGFANPHLREDSSCLVSQLGVLLSEMAAHQVQPDTVTLNTIIKVLAEKSMPKEAEEFLYKLTDKLPSSSSSLSSAAVQDAKPRYARVVPNSSSFSILVSAYLRQGSRGDAKRVLLFGEQCFSVWLSPSIRSKVLESEDTHSSPPRSPRKQTPATPSRSSTPTSCCKADAHDSPSTETNKHIASCCKSESPQI